jgi:hypothetical protein
VLYPIRPGIGHGRCGHGAAARDLRLTRYDERGWRATFYTTGMEHFADERDRHRVGAHAVARDTAGGVGGTDEVQGRATSRTTHAASAAPNSAMRA